MLRQVMFRLQLFGFGNRQNFPQMWTSWQQLICAQSITGLHVGESGEEETELAGLSVQGLATSQLQARQKMTRPFTALIGQISVLVTPPRQI